MNMLYKQVIIRIWTSQFNGGENVGHVSIQTPNNYMSLWPEEGATKSGIKQLLETRPPQFLANPETDFIFEGRRAEVIVCLYTLDTEKMEDEFDRIKRQLKGWRGIGNMFLYSSYAESCATLALNILRSGGLLLNYPVFSSSVTPDKMAEAILVAKRNELVEYPDTANFKLNSSVESESTIMGSGSYRKVTCTIL